MVDRLFIRTDASQVIGAGHLMRMLALAQAWQDQGGEAVFAVCECPEVLRERLADECFDTFTLTNEEAGSPGDLAGTIRLAKRLQVDWIVLDGYHFGPSFQKGLIDEGFRVLLVDDNGHQPRYEAHFLLNQNAYADISLYPNCDSRTQLLLGTPYVLLRREFLNFKRTHPSEALSPRRILVTLGGSDPRHVTAKVLSSLNSWKATKLEIRVLVGACGDNSSLDSLIAHSPHSIELIYWPKSVSDHLRWANAAVTAAGSTVWEALYSDLPIAIVCVADNQKQNAALLETTNSAIFLGSLDDPALESGIEKGLNRLLRGYRGSSAIQVDGGGAHRVVDRLLGTQISLKDADASHSQLLFQWANDPSVRAASFSAELIEWEDHVSWFNKKLHSELCDIYIAYDRTGTPLGQIRFERHDSSATIGLSIDSQFRGMGYATPLIRAGVKRYFDRQNPFIAIHAWIKLSNEASQKAFERARFVRQEDCDYLGQKAAHFVKASLQSSPQTPSPD